MGFPRSGRTFGKTRYARAGGQRLIVNDVSGRKTLVILVYRWACAICGVPGLHSAVEQLRPAYQRIHTTFALSDALDGRFSDYLGISVGLRHGALPLAASNPKHRFKIARASRTMLRRRVPVGICERYPRTRPGHILSAYCERPADHSVFSSPDPAQRDDERLVRSGAALPQSCFDLANASVPVRCPPCADVANKRSRGLPVRVFFPAGTAASSQSRTISPGRDSLLHTRLGISRAMASSEKPGTGFRSLPQNIWPSGVVGVGVSVSVPDHC